MKYCSKCGKEIMEEAVICPGCGCKVEGSNNGEMSSSLANCGFVFAFLIPLVGLILGIIGINKYQNDIEYKNRCIAAIIISVIVWFISFVILVSPYVI